MRTQKVRVVEIEEELRRILDSKLFEERMLEPPEMTLRRTSFQHNFDNWLRSNNNPQ
ncbi:hypothetical protein JW960_29360 [candidate division KSB1 bacterium]|nr:hypothetical protein [candidate division KSB1 bacterium]